MRASAPHLIGTAAAAAGAVIALSIGAGVLSDSDDDVAPSGETSTARVLHVIDGDTVTVRTQDTTEDVRLLGLDAPEVAHPGDEGECFGNESTEALARRLPHGSRVQLLTDPTQNQIDRYGRLLRYVHADGLDVAKNMIRSGAASARRDSPAVQRYDQYAQAENAAQHENRGLWRTCN